MQHLSSETAKQLSLPTPERRQSIRTDKWITYAQAAHAAQQLTCLLDHPPMAQMPDLLIIGDSNNGKTSLLRQFVSTHNSETGQQSAELTCPILFLQAPVDLSERRLYHVILEQLGTALNSLISVNQARQQVMQALQRAEVRLLILDSVHPGVGSAQKWHSFLETLKQLTHELRLPIVMAGTKAAFTVLRHDAQLANRFGVLELPRWTMDEDYLRLLTSFESLLPLRQASDLVREELAEKLLSMSEGLLGELARILQLAAMAAIDSQVERITPHLLDGLSYLPPSNRRSR